MKTRIVFGAVMIVALVGILWLDWHLQQVQHLAVIGLPLAILWAAVGVQAFREMRQLAKSLGIGMLSISGMTSCVAIATYPVWRSMLPNSWATMAGNPVLVLLGVCMAAIFLEQMIRYRIDDGLRRVAATAMTVLYLGVCGAVVLDLRVELGVSTLLMFLAAVKFTDIGAYFTGSAIGKHKLILWLSPGKTWEGLLGGLIAAAAASVLVAWALKVTILGGTIGEPGVLAKTIVFGLVVGAVGQFGDLCESLLKRAASVKDSASLVPEFGGVLDIIDSPLLSAPAAMLLFNILK